MNRIEVELALSQSDRETIVREVLEGVRQLLEDRPALVDGDRLAKILGISRATIDRLVATGKLPSITAGRRRLHDPAECVKALRKLSDGSDAK
jgi:excisionase family DNA binding protein